MANMSYCRFRNTVDDLMDCQMALADIDGDLSSLSDEEQRAANRLLRICRELASDFPPADFEDDD